MNEHARGFPLSRKLTLLLAGTTTVALVLFALIVLAVEAVQSRRALVRDLATQAEIIAVAVAPALETGDWDSAKKNPDRPGGPPAGGCRLADARQSRRLRCRL